MERKWLIPLIILAILLAAPLFRWKTEAQTTRNGVVTKWQKDRWSQQRWSIEYYGTNVERVPVYKKQSAPPPGEMLTLKQMAQAPKGEITPAYVQPPNPTTNKDRVISKTNLGTGVWVLLIIIDSIWLAIGLLVAQTKRKRLLDNDKVGETG